MKWWLKLYTLPFINSFSKVLGLSLLADIAISYFSGSRDLGLLGYGYFIYYGISEFKQNHFRTNLSFHKLSIPLPDLKKAFYLHLLLSYCTIVFSLFLVLNISNAFGGALNHLGESSWALILAGLFFCGLGFVWVRSQGVYDRDHYCFFDPKLVFWKKIVRSLTLFFFMTVFLISVTLFGIPFMTATYLFLFSLAVGCCFFYSRALFHQTQPRASIFSVVKFIGVGAVTVVSLFVFLAFIGRNDHLNKGVSPQLRLTYLLLWQPFTGTLKADEFLELEPYTYGVTETDEFYDLISKEELNSIPSTHFIDKKNPFRLSYYLKYGQVDHHNLSLILDHMESQHEFWKNPKAVKYFRKQIFMNWPNNEPFPERHLAARQQWQQLRESTRGIASEAEKND